MNREQRKFFRLDSSDDKARTHAVIKDIRRIMSGVDDLRLHLLPVRMTDDDDARVALRQLHVDLVGDLVDHVNIFSKYPGPDQLDGISGQLNMLGGRCAMVLEHPLVREGESNDARRT